MRLALVRAGRGDHDLSILTSLILGRTRLVQFKYLIEPGERGTTFGSSDFVDTPIIHVVQF